MLTRIWALLLLVGSSMAGRTVYTYVLDPTISFEIRVLETAAQGIINRGLPNVYFIEPAFW
jgi:hypothetical protein